MARRRILFTLESRATYGYSKNVMLAMREFPELELQTLVTGMHLLPELGNSIQLIRADGLPISAEVPLAPADERPGAWSRALGHGIAGIADAFERLRPDIIVLSGDRVETMGCCIAAAYMTIPTAHIQAGDKSGHIDDLARMAIAKLAHIHFAASADSAERVRRLGEQEFRIFDVGAPQLDDIAGRDYKADRILIDGRAIDFSKPYILLMQHPVLVERDEADAQMAASLKACAETGLPVVWIYPNSDLGYRRILSVMEKWSARPEVTMFPNVERKDYLTLLANAAVLVGNSSSGILEAPSFRVPVINVGNRQRGRVQASNILNTGHDAGEITAAIRRALGDREFQSACARAVNPYGDGKSGPRICKILSEIPIDRRLLDKETVY
ncbi:MAG: UDP-N-acetylglucosamine 2-epimerase (hydrolyzing) [Rhodospirillales bacterium]|nr:UDP-N-acetylglucosamine 2-epimerase (hydrolyzing) [Rhodospirillales bacterium]